MVVGKGLTVEFVDLSDGAELASNDAALLHVPAHLLHLPQHCELLGAGIHGPLRRNEPRLPSEPLLRASLVGIVAIATRAGMVATVSRRSEL